MDATMPAALASSVVGRRLAFFLDRLRDAGIELTDEVTAEHWASEWPSPPPAARRMVLYHFANALGPFVVRRYDATRDDFAVALVEDQRGREWRVWVQLEAAPSRRIHLALPCLAAPPGVVLRPARPDDAAALRELERQCPIVMGDVQVTYDRPDYFAGSRLVGESYPMVAERNGVLVAVHAVLTHPLRVEGRLCQATYLHHTRILPTARRAGLFSALQGAELERHAARTQVIYSYVAVGNDASLRNVPVPQWSTRPERLLIDCRAEAGPARGRPATPDDAAQIVALLNAAHGREELFVPYTVERLVQRLARAPQSYGWNDLLLGDGAVVGVWPAGLRMRRDSPDGREESVRALVLDSGFTPGAESGLVALLRAWCGVLAARDCTHLSIFTSPGSPGREALLSLATRVEPYHFNIGLPEPVSVADRGLYVDQLYF